MRRFNVLKLIIPALLVALSQLTACQSDEPSSGGSSSDNKTYETTGDDIFPVSYESSRNLVLVNVDSFSEDEKVLAYSVQGLINRMLNPTIYMLQSSHEYILDFYKDQGYVDTTETISNVWTLVERYKIYIDGIVVYDSTNANCHAQINLATNIAGLENRIMVTPDMLESARAALGYNKDVCYVTDLADNTPSAMFDYFMENLYPHQTHSVLGLGTSNSLHNINRDYLIAFKVPVFWLPGSGDSDYSVEYENKILNFLYETPTNIPVLGFWPLVVDGVDYGYTEYAGTSLAGYYGKYTVPNNYVGNYTYHSGVRPENTTYEQTKVRAKEPIEYDSTKKYVALIMIESGGSIGYMQRVFFDRQWDQDYREEVEISYAICPAMQYLLPAYLRYLYDTASENNLFYNSLSGSGYCYPFEDYGSRTSDPSATLEEFFKQTAANMANVDMDMLAMYTHPSSLLSTSDLELIDDIATYAPSISSLILGMHYVNGYLPSNSHGQSSTTTWHHTLTNTLSSKSASGLSTSDWDNEEYDQVAAEELIEQIEARAAEGQQFIQAMFYSWSYGSRRMKIVKDTLESQGYVFVTLDEFDRLYRLSL